MSDETYDKVIGYVVALIEKSAGRNEPEYVPGLVDSLVNLLHHREEYDNAYKIIRLEKRIAELERTASESEN